MKTYKVTFSFDERDFIPLETLERRGFRFREIEVRLPTGETRTLVLQVSSPPPLCCYPGRRGDRGARG